MTLPTNGGQHIHGANGPLLIEPPNDMLGGWSFFSFNMEACHTTSQSNRSWYPHMKFKSSLCWLDQHFLLSITAFGCVLTIADPNIIHLQSGKATGFGVPQWFSIGLPRNGFHQGLINFDRGKRPLSGSNMVKPATAVSFRAPSICKSLGGVFTGHAQQMRIHLAWLGKKGWGGAWLNPN